MLLGTIRHALSPRNAVSASGRIRGVSVRNLGLQTRETEISWGDLWSSQGKLDAEKARKERGQNLAFR